MLPPCSRRMQTVDDAFLRALYNYQAAMRGASSAALLCNLAAVGNLCLPNAYSRAAGPRPFKNGFRNHDWFAHSRCGLLALVCVGSRILVSYMPLVHQRRPYPRLRRTLSQRAVPQRVVMVNYRSLPDKYANPLHNTAQKCDVVHLRRLLPTEFTETQLWSQK